jgi:hypothetical protein
MRNEAIAAGLRLEAADNYWKPQDLERAPYKSLASMWHLLEQFPMRRLSYKGNENTSHRLDLFFLLNICFHLNFLKGRIEERAVRSLPDRRSMPP